MPGVGTTAQSEERLHFAILCRRVPQAWNARPPPPPIHPVEALPELVSGAKAPAGRGPAPRLRHRERISAQPKTQQKFVMQMIETVLAQQER